MRELLEKIDKIILTEWKEELDQLANKTARSEPTLKDLKAAEKAATDDISSWTVSDAGMIGNLYGIMAEIYSQPFLFHADGSGRASLATRSKTHPDMYEVIADGTREKDAESVAKYQHKRGILHPNLVKKFKLGKSDFKHDPTGKVDHGFQQALKKAKPKQKDDDYYSAAGMKNSGQDQKITAGLKPGNIEKMVVDQNNIGELLTTYNNILKKYGSNINEAKVSKSDVANDLKMLTAIRDAIQRGLDNGTLPKSSSRTLVNNILKGQSKHTAMLRKAAGFNNGSDSAANIANLDGEKYGAGDTTTTGRETDVVQKIEPKNNTDKAMAATADGPGASDNAELKKNAKTGDRAQGVTTQTGQKASIQTALQGDARSQAAVLAKTLQQLQNTDRLEFLQVVNYLKGEIPELGKSATPAAGNSKEAERWMSYANRPAGAAGNSKEAERWMSYANRPAGPKPGTTLSAQPQVRGNKITQARADANSGGTIRPYQYNNSTDFNDLLRLAGTQKLTEASMNISMTGNTSSEVRELMDILKNAGMDDAMPVKDLDMFKITDEPAPCPHCAAMHGMDSPCGEAVEEEWDNSPDEQYQDDEYMMHDLSGGINRKKERAAQRVKDPAVAYESNLKNSLHGQLKEMYQTLAEKDPFAELDRAIASDDMEGDLERQEKLARLKMKKKDRSRSDAAHDELSKYMNTKEATTGNMSDEQANAIKDKLARLSGTPRAGKNHAQYDKFKNQKPMSLGTAKAPGTAANPGMAKAPGTAANPGMAKAPGTAPNPGMAKAPGTAPNPGKAQAIKTAMNPVTLDLASRAYPGRPPEKVITFFKNKGIPSSELNDYFKMVINKQL